MKFKLSLVLVVLCAVPACEKPGKREAMKDVKNASEQVRADALKDLENGGYDVENPVDYSNLHGALDKMASSSSGQEKLVAQLAKFVVSEMEGLMKPLTAVASDFTAAVDFSSAKTTEDIDMLSEKARNYRKVNGKLKNELENYFNKAVQAKADTLGLKGKERVEFFSGFNNTFGKQMPLLLAIRDQDDMLCEIVLKQHELLKEYFGQWEWSAESGMLEFQNDEALEKFNTLAERINELAVEQQDTQRKLLNL